MKVQDNFLSQEDFKSLQDYCYNCQFNRVQAGEKEFEVLPIPDNLMHYFVKDGKEIVLAFIRKAYKDFDTDYRIHADNIINGKLTSLASVLYVNDEDGVTENGTATWIHNKYGTDLPTNISEQEFDRLIIEDSNDLSKWKLNDFVVSKPNRLVSYNSNTFHSKYPNIIEEGERIVLVVFYS